MRKLMWVGVIVILAGPGVSTERAQIHDGSLTRLRGMFAGPGVGFATVCTNSGGCSAASPTLEQRNYAGVARAQVDGDGNFCATSNSSLAPVAGSAAPASSPVRTITGSIASFDAATEQGDLSFSIYNGGSCNGASFESDGATLASKGTGHFVVAEKGWQIHSVVTSYVSVAGIVGSVVGGFSFHRQRMGAYGEYDKE
jgi:hypothetical protein